MSAKAAPFPDAFQLHNRLDPQESAARYPWCASELYHIDHGPRLFRCIALLGDSFEAVQEVLEEVERYVAAVGLRINAAKTKVISAQVAVS